MKKTIAALTALVMAMTSMSVLTANAAQAYAQGDVDMDGLITGYDAALVSRHVLDDSFTLSEEQAALADVNADGAVTQDDAAQIYANQAYALGDVDDDGDYDILDSLKMMKMCAPYYEGVSDEMLTRADVDADGLITADDAFLLLTYYALYGGAMPVDFYAEGYYFNWDAENVDKPMVGKANQKGEQVYNLLGDLNNDGYKDYDDLKLMKLYVETGEIAEEAQHWIVSADMNLDAVIDQTDLDVMRAEFDAVSDVNQDGVVDLSDASLVLTMYAQKGAGLESAVPLQQSANVDADVNGDGVVGLSDATAVLTQYTRNCAGLN
ncbi:MAG: hypothetical protein IJ496_05260 [Ruminococcus sp.]|nr:hypothetical protein [Ruminococcus sp.]